MKKILISVLLVITVVIFLLGFVDIANEVPVQNEEIFTYSITTIPRNLKAIGTVDKREQDIVCATSKGLIEIDKDGKIIPSLSESVDIKEDGIEYDFKIRDDIYWSNGERITSKDIVEFFKEVLIEEEEESIIALLDVYGAKGFRDGVVKFNEGVGIQATENRVIIRLNSKNLKFLEELSKPQYRIRNGLIYWENISENLNQIKFSGEYSINSIDMKEIILKRNSKSNPNMVETIQIIEDEGEEIAMAAFEVGNRDIVVEPPASQLSRLEKEGRLVTLKSNLAMYLAFNPKATVLNIEGRQEIYSLINKAIGEYQLQNEILLELAEGSYFREDKEDLSKLQSRKVLSNIDTEWEQVEEVVLIAKDNVQNKELCSFLSEWFKNNTEIILSYDLKNNYELNKLEENNYYDIALIQCETSPNNKKRLFEELDEFIPNSYKEKLEISKKEEEKNEALIALEDNLFATYTVLPLMFYNKSIAISEKIINIALDGNGNINFIKLEK